MSIAILGAGSWGTAIAIAIASSGVEVRLWGRDHGVISTIVNKRENVKYLTKCKIPENVFVSSNLLEILKDVIAIIIAIPTQSLSSLCAILSNHVFENVPIVICSKGIDKKSLSFPSEIVQEFFRSNPILVLSGPSFANEVGLLLPCSLVLASTDRKTADFLIDKIDTNNFRIAYSEDVIGVQVASVLKNVIAIACGIIYGNGLGRNAVSTIITYGMEEVKKLYLAKTKSSINFETIMGPACLGDLVLTCTSTCSRNMSFGLQVGQGASISELLKKNDMVIEGVSTVKSLFDLSNILNIRLPISDIIYRLIYENMFLETAINKILNSY